MFQARILIRSIAMIGMLTALACADIIVTLVPQDDNTNVPAGATVPVDILLSVDGDDSPLVDLRLMQFDFADTSDSITLSGFVWQIDLPNGSEFYFQSVTFPSPSAAYFGTMDVEGFILGLDETPIRVATINIVANATGSLDAIATVGEADASGALFSAAFDSPVDFNRATGNLQGGVLNFQVAAGGGGGGTLPDADDDDVPDAVDDFPNDNDETTDTDNDNIGNVADPDDDDDGIDDVEDPTPLGPQEVIDNDNQSNDNANDNGSGGNGGDNENDNSDTNMGPRATGGIFCAQGMILAMMGSFVGLSVTRLIRRRNEASLQR